jgi:hypothetical protein
MSLRSRLTKLEATTAAAGPYLSTVAYEPDGPCPFASYYPNGSSGWLSLEEVVEYEKTGLLPERYRDAPSDRPRGPLIIIAADEALEAALGLGTDQEATDGPA